MRAQGADAFRELLAAAQPLSEFVVGELVRQVDASHADGRSKLVALARPLLERLPRGVYRELLSRELAERVGIEPGRFAELVEPTGAHAPRGPGGVQRGGALAAAPDYGKFSRPADGPGERAHKGGGARPSRIRYAIKLILHYPEAGRAAEPPEALWAVAQPGAALLQQLLEIVRDNPNITRTAQLLERFRGEPDERHLQKLAATPPLDEEPEAAQVLRDSLALIVRDDERRRRGETLMKRSAESRTKSGVGPAQVREPDNSSDAPNRVYWNV